MLTLTDMFCGAGGSSTGAIQIPPDVEVVMAANHWPLAIETHSANHPPTTDHRCADLSQISPRYSLVRRWGWFSPECTNHTIAKGRKRADAQPDLFGEILPDEAAERSRATMWDVVRFTEYHRYELVFVENVVDAYHWQPFRAWLMAMDSLGYEHHIVFVNSMHAQAFGPARRSPAIACMSCSGARETDALTSTGSPGRRLCVQPVGLSAPSSPGSVPTGLCGGAATAHSTSIGARTWLAATRLSNRRSARPLRSSTGICSVSVSVTERSHSRTRRWPAFRRASNGTGRRCWSRWKAVTVSERHQPASRLGP